MSSILEFCQFFELAFQLFGLHPVSSFLKLLLFFQRLWSSASELSPPHAVWLEWVDSAISKALCLEEQWLSIIFYGRHQQPFFCSKLSMFFQVLKLFFSIISPLLPPHCLHWIAFQWFFQTQSLDLEWAAAAHQWAVESLMYYEVFDLLHSWRFLVWRVQLALEVFEILCFAQQRVIHWLAKAQFPLKQIKYLLQHMPLI